MDIRADFQVRCTFEIDYISSSIKNLLAKYRVSDSEHVKQHVQLQVLLTLWGTEYLRAARAQGKQEPFRDSAPRFLEVLKITSDRGGTVRMTFASLEAASVMNCAKSISFGVEGEFDVTLTTQTDNIAILKHAVVISATPNARTAVSGQFQSQLISMITEQASYNGQRPLYLYGSKGDIIKATDITIS